jgi:two-component system, HptB-dependent secretion and biofilm response regulator
LRILVADDDALFHIVANAVLVGDGYEVIHARDGLEALNLYQEHKPDLVLTDYQMPGLNGIELCRSVKALDPQRFIPMVMLTGEEKSQVLRESLDAGFVEFLTKPVTPDELRLRVRSLFELILLHKDLALAKSESDEEMLITKHILHRLVEPGLRTLPSHIHMETLHTQRINGDACAYQQGLPGIHFGLLCDATGHGLAAGVSTIPAIQAFLGMVSRDIPLEMIYREINVKLRKILPSGRFVCLMLTRLDLHSGTLSVLNAGLPDALFLTPKGTARRFASRNLPAGVLDQVEEPVVEEVALSGGERLLAFTDGLQDFLGAEAAYRILAEGVAKVPFRVHKFIIQECLNLAIHNHEQHDDVSWALWEVPRPEFVKLPIQSNLHCSLQALQCPSPTLRSTPFAFELCFDPRSHPLRQVLPDCLRLLGNHGVPSAATQTLAMALTEATTNALDHGLLGMESTLKQEGFEVYDTVRKERLAAHEVGTLTLRLQLHRCSSGSICSLGVEVEDTGPGFDWRAWEQRQAAEDTMVSGRGLVILRSIASEMSFNESGNCLRFSLPCG